LTHINIPESVKRIGGFAFSGCISLANITIPKGTKSIGDWAFEGCTSLVSITLPRSIRKIGKDIFKGCRHVTIHTPRDSTAWRYAEEKKINCVEINMKKKK